MFVGWRWGYNWLHWHLQATGLWSSCIEGSQNPSESHLILCLFHHIFVLYIM